MPESRSWQSLAALLQQNHCLTDKQADDLARLNAPNSPTWLSAWLNLPDTPFTTQTLAHWFADKTGIPRAQSHELNNPLQANGQLKQAVDKLNAPEGIICLSEQPACLGIVDPSSSATLQRLKFLINQPFEWRIISLTEYHAQHSSDATNISSQRFNSPLQPEANSLISPLNETNATSGNNNAPMVRYIHELMSQMIRQRASDLHFEPFATHYRIRARIDGVLHEIDQPDVALKEQIAVRLKVMAQLDIAEKRLPQDGRIKLQFSHDESIDCRVSSMPTLFGEKIVVRFLNNQDTDLNISHLGYEPEQRAALETALAHPHGLILMTGPTGSGKTVSLYACLNQLNQEHVNISSVEDPVEILLSGINQVSINEKAGIDFATVLRAFLRQDPDILMVGEIRDLETADIALKAAQTGHLVFSTLHTNDAPLALARLSQMGVTPYNIASAVSLITAQRLVRKLCSCKKPVHIDPALLMSAGFDADTAQQSDWQAYAPTGCPQCHHTGFLGRIGVFQVLPISSAMQTLIANNANAQELRTQALNEGVLTLRQAGLLKVQSGLCTLDEIMAATL